MLYLSEKKTLDSLPSSSMEVEKEQVKVQEDEVDKLLAAMDGRVHRKKDPQM